MNLLPELGFECLTENEDFFMNCLLRYVMENGSVFRGYYGSYIWKNIGSIEMNFHILPGEDSYHLAGFTSHVSGDQVWQLAVADSRQCYDDDECESVLEHWVTFTHPLTHEGSIRLYLVNADVVPDFFPNDVIAVQVIAIAQEVTYYADEDAYNQSEPLAQLMGKPVHFASNNVLSILDMSVAVGAIKDVSMRFCTDAKGKPKEFYCVTIATSYGTLEIMHAKERVAEGEEALIRPGGFVKANCMLLGDVAMGKYQRGAIHDQEHLTRLFRSCIECRDFTRITNVLAEDCRYRSRKYEIVAQGKADVFAHLSGIAAKQKEQEMDCRAYPAVVFAIEGNDEGEEASFEFPIGTHCIALSQNEEGNIDAVLFIMLNEDNQICEIRNAGEKEGIYKVKINRGEDPARNDDFAPVRCARSEREWLEVIQACYEQGHFDDIAFYYGMLPDCVLESETPPEVDVDFPIIGREPIYTYLSGRVTYDEHTTECEILDGSRWGHEYALKTDIDSSVHMTVIDVDAEGAIVKISEYQP